tara:strand:+ start:7883 stop:9379 length:1497 start_codon:yes stop_codon:yes gene_type:complete
MRWFALAVVSLLCVSSIPASSAGGDGLHWNGYGLDRSSIPNHVLVDQDGNNYSIQRATSDVTVVAFIFTTCVDVCPVITNNLLTAESQLEDVDYEFISITVDPATDTPEVLKAYMEDSGATWPHLTGELEDLEVVWSDFQIEVETEVIDSHDHSEVDDEDGNMSEHDGHNGDGDMDSEDAQTVTVIMPDGNKSVHQVMPNGWDQLTAAAYQNNWTINASESQWGHYVTGINGDESPSDYSWWWELHAWNESTNSWEGSNLGIDSVDVGNLAFAPNSTEDSLIPAPDMENDSFVILLSNGSNDSSMLSHVSAWHMTLAALDSFEAPSSQWGHYMSSIENVSAPADYSWWWQLHYWNMANDSWEESSLGMDSLYDQTHIAWAPNSTMDSMIPHPTSEDEGSDHESHSDMEESEEGHSSNQTTTSTSHSTQTFILDEDWNPMVVFLGYDWNVDDFVEDVERAANTADGHGIDDDDSILPGFTIATLSASLSLAIIAARRQD